MSKGNYDLLTGFNQDKLNQIIAKVYSTPNLKSTLFTGSEFGSEMGVSYTLNWAVEAAPTVSLTSPTSDNWANAIGVNGVSVAAKEGAFLVNLSTLKINIDAGDQKLDTTIPVQAIALAGNSGANLQITTLGVIIDLSKASTLDKAIITSALVPAVLKMLNKSLSGIEIPQLSFSGVTLTAPVVEAKDGYILAAFNLTKDGAPSIGTVPAQNTPFFAIVSRELAQFVSDYQVQTNIQGQKFDQSGKESGGGFSAEYAVHGQIKSIRVAVTSDPIVMQASASLAMSASAGVSTPVGYVIDAAGNVVKEVGKVVEDVGKAIINPDTWNPAKW